MGDLQRLWNNMNDGTCHKWFHYLEIYERYLSKFRNAPVTFLEIGVQAGGSLKLMKQYLGHEAKIIGIDVDPTCKELESTEFTIHIGSQDNKDFLQAVCDQHKKFNIIIDDGGHLVSQQIISFETLWPFLEYGGVYLIEDLHCSQYWKTHGAGEKTFLDYAYSMANRLSKWHEDRSLFHDRYSVPPERRSEQGPKIDDFATKEIWAISYYDSIIAIEKRLIPEPYQTRK